MKNAWLALVLLLAGLLVLSNPPPMDRKSMPQVYALVVVLLVVAIASLVAARLSLLELRRRNWLALRCSSAFLQLLWTLAACFGLGLRP